MTESDTVLVVDDEQDLADLYSAFLAPDYDVLVAYDGQAAVEKMNDRIDVVLLDRRMPGMSGDEVLEHIRSQYPNCMVAFVTGIDPADDISTRDFDMYLQKPAQGEELRGAVETLLRRQSFGHQEQTM